MTKKQTERIEIEIVDFDDKYAVLQFYKTDFYCTLSLNPEQLEELALLLLSTKTKIELIETDK